MLILHRTDQNVSNTRKSYKTTSAKTMSTFPRCYIALLCKIINIVKHNFLVLFKSALQLTFYSSSVALHCRALFWKVEKNNEFAKSVDLNTLYVSNLTAKQNGTVKY